MINGPVGVLAYLPNLWAMIIGTREAVLEGAHRARVGMLALDRAQTFPAAPELLFRMIERRRVPLHPDLDIRINVSRDRPEPAQFPGCLSILAHAPDLTAVLSHDIIKAVSVDRGGAGLTEDESHVRIVPASTPRRLHLYVAPRRMPGQRPSLRRTLTNQPTQRGGEPPYSGDGEEGDNSRDHCPCNAVGHRPGPLSMQF